MTVSELRQKPRLSGHERLSKDEVEMLMDLDEEFMRRGNFQRIFPLASNAAFYDQFFETKRYQNALCASYLTSPQHIRDQLLYKYRRVYNSQVWMRLSKIITTRTAKRERRKPVKHAIQIPI